MSRRVSVISGMLAGMRALVDLLLPGRCAGCGQDGPALCDGCATLLGPPCLVRAGAATPLPVYALGRYRGPLRAALLAYKERGRRELAAPFGAALAAALRTLDVAAPGVPGAAATGGPGSATAGGFGGVTAGVWLVPAPSRGSAARRRGGEHVRRLAERAAAELAAGGVPAAVAPALRLASGVRDSVGLDAAARVANLAGGIRVRRGGLPPPGTSVVLVDDVVTTGATAAAGTRALTAAGVDVRAVLVLAAAAPLVRSGDIRDRSVTSHRAGRTVVSITA